MVRNRWEDKIRWISTVTHVSKEVKCEFYENSTKLLHYKPPYNEIILLGDLNFCNGTVKNSKSVGKYEEDAVKDCGLYEHILSKSHTHRYYN